MKSKAKSIEVYQGDLPAGMGFGDSVAVDTEAQGLNPNRDRLCVVQVSAGGGVCHLVQFPDADFTAPNLKALFTDDAVTKIFHYARFDVAMIERYLGITCTPLYCTKIASRLARTFTDRHGLKDLCREVLGISISKEQQSSDWGATELTASQIEYAAADVLHLHRLRERLDEMLVREGRDDLAKACFAFVPHRAALDLAGWGDSDIFAH